MKSSKLKLRNRFLGLFILTKSLLPILIFAIAIFIPIQLFGPDNNKKLHNLYHHEVDILQEHFHEITYQVDSLRANVMVTLNELVSIKNSLSSYLTEKGELAEEIWTQLIGDINATVDEIKMVKDLIVIEIKKYILIVENMISQVRTYVTEIFQYKDQISHFLDQMMQELEPINDVLDFIHSLDVFGALDEFTIDIPALPVFPSFPEIDFEQLKPDLDPLKKAITNIVSDIAQNFESFKTELNNLLTPPDFSQLIAVFNINNLKSNFITPLYNMKSILFSYHMELQKAQIMINDELLERKASIKPWENRLILVIIVSLIFWFIVYLINLKDNLILAFKLLKGEDVNFSFKKI